MDYDIALIEEVEAELKNNLPEMIVMRLITVDCEISNIGHALDRGDDSKTVDRDRNTLANLSQAWGKLAGLYFTVTNRGAAPQSKGD